MVSKVEAEGKKEAAAFEKFMCYCKNSGGDLQESIDNAKTRIPELESAIEAAASKKAQLEKDVEEHQNDRAAAEKAMAEATEVREKEKAAFDKLSSDQSTNLAAIGKAITAISAGIGESFLQSSAAATLRAVMQNSNDADRSEVLAFLSGNQEYAPQSGGILGILKQMQDEMVADNKDTIEKEETAVKEYKAVMAAKKKEVSVLEKMIEQKLERIAELGVKVAELKNDLEDTQEGLTEDEKFQAQLEKGCKNKAGEWEERKKVRAEELLALSDTIKVLNDDDALDLFKKTLPTPASFLQVQVSAAAMKAQALAAIKQVQNRDRKLDFIALALHGKKIGFDQVIKMIDDLVATLKQEQQDDDNKKEYCAAEFDASDDKKKALERSIADLETVIAESKEGIQTLGEEIEALGASIKALDKSVAEATATRKEEHADYKELMANDGAAKELLGFAKNRLNKFYNPKLYKAPPKRQMSEEERITVNMGGTLAPTSAPGGIAGTGISALQKDAPPPPPETFGAYQKKSGESNGVMAMIDLLVKDLDKEMTEAKVTEKDAQSDYEALMKDAQEKRTENSKSLADKEAARADLKNSLETSTADKVSTEKEHSALLQYIQSLHGECDWLLKYFDVRKEARASEVDALGKAKAVLNGADFSLVQEASRRSVFLHRH